MAIEAAPRFLLNERPKLKVGSTDRRNVLRELLSWRLVHDARSPLALT